MTQVDHFRGVRHWIALDHTLYTRPLKTLRIQGKGLRHISHDIFTFTDLEALDLRPEREACLGYHLQEIPPAIGLLTNLRVLLLDTNELYSVPREIAKLLNLKKLSLSNNNLSCLPDEFGLLRNLKSLHLSNNQFEVFPPQLCRIAGLEFLDMCDNQLEELPRDIVRLTSLHTLLLFHNALHTLPPSITTMTQLRCLWLGDNKLQYLPSTFGNLRNLDWNDTSRYMMSSVIDNNPLVRPPLFVCKRGIDAIAQYFHQNSSTGSHQSVNRK